MMGGAIARLVSSLTITPSALAVVMVAPVGSDRITAKVSSLSAIVSPLTSMVIVLLVSPASKVTVPVGKLPPKSFASAG